MSYQLKGNNYYETEGNIDKSEGQMESRNLVQSYLCLLYKPVGDVGGGGGEGYDINLNNFIHTLTNLLNRLSSLYTP